jgi:hypothetical protein
MIFSLQDKLKFPTQWRPKSIPHRDAALKLIEIKSELELMEKFVLEYMRHPEATDEDAKVVRTAYADTYKRFQEARDAVRNYEGEAK